MFTYPLSYFHTYIIWYYNRSKPNQWIMNLTSVNNLILMVALMAVIINDLNEILPDNIIVLVLCVRINKFGSWIFKLVDCSALSIFKYFNSIPISLVVYIVINNVTMFICFYNLPQVHHVKENYCLYYYKLYTFRKDFAILQLYWWLFGSTKHCSKIWSNAS